MNRWTKSTMSNMAPNVIFDINFHCVSHTLTHLPWLLLLLSRKCMVRESQSCTYQFILFLFFFLYWQWIKWLTGVTCVKPQRTLSNVSSLRAIKHFDNKWQPMTINVMLWAVFTFHRKHGCRWKLSLRTGKVSLYSWVTYFYPECHCAYGLKLCF